MSNINNNPKVQEIFSYQRMGCFVDKNHILMKISEIYDFHRWEKILENCFVSHTNKGRKDDNVLLKAKMVFLGFYYNLSDREVESALNENVVYREFCGMGVDAKSIDHSHLSKFRKVIGDKKAKKLFEDVVSIARESEIVKDKWNAADATHLKAKASDSRKIISNDKAEISREMRNPGAWRTKDPKPPVDKDARWGAKSKDKIFYGYKAHAAMDVASNIITKLYVTSGEKNDGNYLKDILEQKAKNITADKIYDNAVNRVILGAAGIRNWIYRKKKEVPYWLRKQRSGIERKFGEAKKWHNLEECRYIGLERTSIQCYFTAMALNLKRMVQLAT